MEEDLLIGSVSKETLWPRKMRNEVNHANLHVTKRLGKDENTDENAPECNQIENEEDVISHISKDMINDGGIVAVDLLFQILRFLGLIRVSERTCFFV